MLIVEEFLDTSSASSAWDTAKVYKNRAGYQFRQFTDH